MAAQKFTTGFSLPEGASLVGVRNPSGSDEPMMYYVTYQVFGVTLSYQVGGDEELRRLFGGRGQFNSFQGMSDTEFKRMGTLMRGSIDEQLNQSESIESQMERGMEALGLEGLPAWQKRSPEVMATLLVAQQEGWGSGRTLQALSRTEGFKQRFSGFDEFRSRAAAGMSLSAALEEYTRREDQISALLERFRPGQKITTGYLGRVIGTGWSASEVGEILRAEQVFDSDPKLAASLNRILEQAGQEAIAGKNAFIELMRGNGPADAYEAINDAIRWQKLRAAGVTIDAALAAQLGEGVSEGVATEGQRQQWALQARQAANDLIANWQEIDVGKYGISKSEVVRAAFGEALNPETEAKLLKIGREREAAAEGTGGGQAYQSDRGRLVIAGLEGL